jgi:hypothetical protein
VSPVRQSERSAGVPSRGPSRLSAAERVSGVYFAAPAGDEMGFEPTAICDAMFKATRDCHP